MIDRESTMTKTHSTVVMIITIACVCVILENLLHNWEYWVPPLIVCGVIGIWALHILQYWNDRVRESIYLSFSMLVMFYHGVHEESIFDIVFVCSLVMGLAALLRRKGFLHLILSEYFLLMLLQVPWAFGNGYVYFDTNNVSRIFFQIIVEACLYFVFKEIIEHSQYADEIKKEMDAEKEEEDVNMEDFLVNISHELRTPVNVINGMSSIILKKNDSDDIRAIRNAGVRMSTQIEDIQDYSEIKRGNVVLEEERYMITSVLNDVLVHFRSIGKNNKLEFIIDLDPTVPAMMSGDVKKIQKIIMHLLENAFKFTRRGGVYIKVSAEKKEYGANLVIEVSDTGVGMTARDIDGVSKGLYQANKKRNRSTGGIGLGLSIVYGFVRKMKGFVTIDSQKGRGTTVRVTVAQEVINPSPCLSITKDSLINVVMYIDPSKFQNSTIWEYNKAMAYNMASGLRINLYFAPSLDEMKKLMTRGDITHVFIGAEEYIKDNSYFDELALKDVIVTVSANDDFKVSKGSKVIIMPKPLYGFNAVKIINGLHEKRVIDHDEDIKRPNLDGIRALVVDDEPMNLVVATGLFNEYNMVIDTADSGKEAIYKYENNEYDLVFMDHMMPEMDGVETMKRMKHIAAQEERNLRIIALTANAISGAKEMFIREGFDGFISKPININDFERVISSVLPESIIERGGGAS